MLFIINFIKRGILFGGNSFFRIGVFLGNGLLSYLVNLLYIFYNFGRGVSSVRVCIISNDFIYRKV